MWQNQQKTEDLVTFTGEIFTGKLHFLYSDSSLQTVFPFPTCFYVN